MPSRNESCPCGSGRKYKRCCLELWDAVSSELRERDAFLADLVAWLKAEHEETLAQAVRETFLIRMSGGPIGRNMLVLWALNDYEPTDGGPPLMVRYADRPCLDPAAREIARGLAEARLDVYQVADMVDGLWVELQPLRGDGRLRAPLQDGLARLEVGEVLVARMVMATAMPTPWGLGSRFPGDSVRRWKARLAALPADRAHTALTVLGFQPEDWAEPLPDGALLYRSRWSIEDEGAVGDAIEEEDLWESIGKEIPDGWAYAWPENSGPGVLDLGGWPEEDGQIEAARLVVCEDELKLISGNRQILAELAALIEQSFHDLIAPAVQVQAA
jgi:hypothetical protein